MQNPPLTTKRSHWTAAREVKAGQYFKYCSSWYLAIAGAVAATGEWEHLYAYVIHAYGPDGCDRWVGIHKQPSRVTPIVEVFNAGGRPGPFTPATLRKKARAHREESQRQLMWAAKKEEMARRLESGAIAG